MLVLSSPSGAGKTTLSRLLLETDDTISMSVSATTRKRRSNEIDGRDYFFVDDAEFERRVAADDFLEHANVFGHRYGTPRRAVMDALARGEDVLFDIDWQGTQQLRQQARDDVVSVFVLPPSHAELERRLRARAPRRGICRAAPHGQGRRRDQPLGGVRLHHRQRRCAAGAEPARDDPCRRAAQAGTPGGHSGVRERADPEGMRLSVSLQQVAGLVRNDPRCRALKRKPCLRGHCHMQFVEWIGALAALASTASFAPQALKIIRTRQTKDISTGMYLLTVSAFAAWTLYGAMLGRWPLIARQQHLLPAVGVHPDDEAVAAREERGGGGCGSH
jgi:guanylate kinase